MGISVLFYLWGCADAPKNMEAMNIKFARLYSRRNNFKSSGKSIQTLRWKLPVVRASLYTQLH